MVVPLGGSILVNDTPAKADTRVYENFTLTWDVNAVLTYADLEEETEEEAAARHAARDAAREAAEDVSREAAEAAVRESAATAPQTETETLAGSGSVQETDNGISDSMGTPSAMHVIVNKFPVTLQGKSSYVYVDVFSFINFDLNASGGRNIITLLNGRKAEYMEPLSGGDVIEIYWEERKQ